MPSPLWETYFIVNTALIEHGKPTIAEYHEERKKERKRRKLKEFLS